MPRGSRPPVGLPGLDRRSSGKGVDAFFSEDEQEIQDPGNPATHTAGNMELQDDGLPEMQNDGLPATKKRTYRLEYALDDTIEDMYHNLKRRYKTKRVTHEDVIHAAITLLYEDWQANPQAGYLAKWIARKPEMQKDGKTQ